MTAPVAAGRPARRYYRLTPDGTVAARTAVAALYESLARGYDRKRAATAPTTPMSVGSA